MIKNVVISKQCAETTTASCLIQSMAYWLEVNPDVKFEIIDIPDDRLLDPEDLSGKFSNQVIALDWRSAFYEGAKYLYFIDDPFPEIQAFCAQASASRGAERAAEILQAFWLVVARANSVSTVSPILTRAMRDFAPRWVGVIERPALLGTAAREYDYKVILNFSSTSIDTIFDNIDLAPVLHDDDFLFCVNSQQEIAYLAEKGVPASRVIDNLKIASGSGKIHVHFYPPSRSSLFEIGESLFHRKLAVKLLIKEISFDAHRIADNKTGLVVRRVEKLLDICGTVKKEPNRYTNLAESGHREYISRGLDWANAMRRVSG